MVVKSAARRNPEDVQAYYDIELAAARLDQYCFDVQESSRRGTVDHERWQSGVQKRLQTLIETARKWGWEV